MIRPPPGEVGMVLEDGVADGMTRDAPSRVGGLENGFVGFSVMDAVIWTQNLR